MVACVLMLSSSVFAKGGGGGGHASGGGHSSSSSSHSSSSSSHSSVSHFTAPRVSTAPKPVVRPVTFPNGHSSTCTEVERRAKKCK